MKTTLFAFAAHFAAHGTDERQAAHLLVRCVASLIHRPAYEPLAVGHCANAPSLHSNLWHSNPCEPLASLTETMTGNIDLGSNINAGLIVCDEAHRLKNQDTKVFKELYGLRSNMRIMVSGTPVQK